MERKQWLDNARALACLMVIVVHVTAITKYSYGKIDDMYWYITVFLDSATRMCVPIFFMISGCIFLGTKKVKLKNIIKIFTALTFYSILCMAYWAVFKDRSFIDGVLTIYQRPALYHMWFMFYIFAFYILFLIINIREVNPWAGLFVVIAVMTLLNGNVGEITQLLFNYNFKNNFVINSFHLQLFMYCFAGAFISRIDVKNNYVVHAWVICLASIACIIYLTIMKSMQIGKLDALYQNYNSIPVFFSAISAFYLLMVIPLKESFGVFVSFLAERSLAIYGVHAIFLEIIRTKQYFMFSNPLMNLITTYLAVLIFSVLAAALIKMVDKKGYIS